MYRAEDSLNQEPPPREELAAPEVCEAGLRGPEPSPWAQPPGWLISSQGISSSRERRPSPGGPCHPPFGRRAKRRRRLKDGERGEALPRNRSGVTCPQSRRARPDPGPGARAHRPAPAPPGEPGRPARRLRLCPCVRPRPMFSPHRAPPPRVSRAWPDRRCVTC